MTERITAKCEVCGEPVQVVIPLTGRTLCEKHNIIQEVGDLIFIERKIPTGDGNINTQNYCHVEQGFISILDRQTGFSFAPRDTETAFRDKDNKFWLKSGMFDIRDYPDKTIDEAIDLIKGVGHQINREVE